MEFFNLNLSFCRKGLLKNDDYLKIPVDEKDLTNGLSRIKNIIDPLKHNRRFQRFKYSYMKKPKDSGFVNVSKFPSS